MEVRVLTAPPSSGYPEQDYICVHTDADPLDDTVVLATIERVTDRTKGKVKRVKTLLARVAHVRRRRARPRDELRRVEAGPRRLRRLAAAARAVGRHRILRELWSLRCNPSLRSRAATARPASR